MNFSTLPLIVLAVAAFPSALAMNAYRVRRIVKTDLVLVLAFSGLIVAWVGVTGYVAYAGFYRTGFFLSLLPGLWMPLVPLIVLAVPLTIVPRLRSALWVSGLAAPRHWFAYFQATRIAAVGTAVKAYRGEFPATVEWLVGVPDMLFGISAVWVASRMRQGHLSDQAWYAWHAIGAGIILVVGMVVINISLPGPFQWLQESPTFEVAFDFPLALAPTAVVPLQAAANLWAMMICRAEK